MHLPTVKSVPEYAFDALSAEIDSFQRRLSPDTEIGIVAQGGGGIIHIEDFSMRGQMFIFEGVDSEGRAACVVQHFTQANVQLIAVPKTQEQPRRIGF